MRQPVWRVRSGFPVGEVGTVARNRSPDKLSFLGMVKTDADFFFHLMFYDSSREGSDFGVTLEWQTIFTFKKRLASNVSVTLQSM